MRFLLHNRPHSFIHKYSVLLSCVLSWKCSYSERKTRQCFGSQSAVTLRIQSHKACSRSAQCTPWSDLICSQSHCSALTMDGIYIHSVIDKCQVTYLHINSQRNATLRLFYTVIVFQQSVPYMHKVCESYMWCEWRNNEHQWWQNL